MKNIFKNQFIAIIGAVIYGLYSLLGGAIVKGADVTFNEKVNAIFKENMENPIILNQVLKSPVVVEFGTKMTDTIYTNLKEIARKEDSLLKSENEYIAKELDIRTEKVLDLKVKLYRDAHEGNFITEEEYEHRTNRRTVRAVIP